LLAPVAMRGFHRHAADGHFGHVYGYETRRLTPGPARPAFPVVVEPRSDHVLGGAAQSEWQHSIPAVDALRYSITFRSVKSRR
jgi:hypothetical protein